ncbi:MAG: hypothetical protein DRR42_12260 [Gammaproteobacteria bacterium]|nr:MAG: hypothetical protein DRR42_12260 [Gammaproteobacteria bacterium]
MDCSFFLKLFFIFFLALSSTQVVALKAEHPPEIIVIKGFDEPLIHQMSKPYIPLSTPQNINGLPEIERLLRYQGANHNTPWEASIELNLGLTYYRNGYFSKTFTAFERAWALSKDEDKPAQKAVADRAFGELVRMHARLGHADKVEALLATVENRSFSGRATEFVSGARESVWIMRNKPGISYLCGSKALHSLLDWQQPGAKGLSVLDEYRSGEQGINLSKLQSLAEQADMHYRLAYRETSEIPVPSVIHWKVNHYAAIVEKKGGLFHVKDPTFGQDLWLTAEAINNEASGYFLVPENNQKSWSQVQVAQADLVYGQGYTGNNDKDRTTCRDAKKSKAPCDGNDKASKSGESGMADYDVHIMLVSLIISDTPIRYTPPKGYPIRFMLRYNQREANQPSNFTFSNVGPKWTHNWLTYIEDSPTNSSAVINRMVAGGGAIDYNGYNTGTGEYESGVSDTSRLYRTSTDPIVYERRLPGGGSEMYASSDGATSGVRRVFLSQQVDTNGNTTTLNYDADLRLVSVTDALGQETVFIYAHESNTKLITQVIDPFGREALITYDASGRLSSITDPVGIVSAFSYDNGDFITALNTPYGETAFAYTGSSTSRTLTITDPYGEQEHIVYGHRLGISSSVSGVPSGDILTRNRYHNYRNTAYWDKQTYKDYGPNISKAEVSHWLHTTNKQSSGLFETFKKPLENRIWYNYSGQTNAITETNIYQEKHTRIGRVLDDGSSQIFIRQFNDFGKPVYREDPLGNYTRYDYASNQIDLLQVTQLRDGIEEVTASYTWDDRHNRLSAADGRGHATAYTYNAAGQMLTQTNALGHTTEYEYDAQGYLVKVTFPTGKTTQFSYDAVGRRATYIDTEGHTQTYRYDGLNRLLRTTYEDGTSVEYSWDVLDLVRIRDRVGRETHFDYDDLRRKVSQTDHLGRVTAYAYDASDRLLSVTNALGQVTHFEYDIQGRKTADIDAEGHRTEYHYENTTSRLATVVDANNGQTTNTYDLANRLIALTDPNNHTTQFMFDEAGNTVEQVSPDSGATLYRYDVMGLIGQTDARGLTVNYSYDALNRLQHTQYADSAYDILMSYDGSNYEDGVADSLLKQAIGQPTGMTDNSGQTLWYYNIHGDLKGLDTLFNDLGNTAFSQQFEYDYRYEPGVGRMTQHTYPDGQSFTYQYDDHGRVKAIESIAGGTTKVAIDDVAYQPVLADGIAGYTYGNGLITQRQVDALGQLTDLSVQGVQNVFQRQWSYTPANDIASIDDQLDATGTRAYTYDALHQLTDAVGPTNQTYSYDANSNRLSKNTAVYTPDSNSNRLQSVVEGSTVTGLFHDANGNRIAQNVGVGDSFSYEYDPRNRLMRLSDNSGVLASYQYNGAGQRVVKTTTNGTRYSLYNPQGQRIGLYQGDGSLAHNTLYWNGQPLAHYRPDTESSCRFTSIHENREPAYLNVDLDEQRIELTRYDGTVLDVVIEDDLWNIVETGEGTVYHFAIGEGKTMLLKGWVHFRQAGEQGFAHLTDKIEGHPVEYRFDGGRVLKDYYYHLDHLGTPQVMTDADQTVVWQGSYTPFGQANVLTETIDNDLRFPGQYYDEESGLHYNYFRDYDPSMGRYITSDPIGLGAGTNTYGYVQQNPLIYIDQLGLFGCRPAPEISLTAQICDSDGGDPYASRYCPSGDCAAYNPDPELTNCIRTCVLKSVVIGEVASQTVKTTAKGVTNYAQNAVVKSVAGVVVKKIPIGGNIITVLTLPGVFDQCQKECEEGDCDK